MRTIEVKLYQFEELSDAAKAKARDWYKTCEAQSYGSHGEIFEPAEAAAKLLGITFADNAVKLMGGRTRIEPDIRYSGFSCQGDGASFVGSYEYRKGSSKAVRAEFGTDAELWRIAEELTELQRQYGYRIKANITQSGRYVHDMTMDAEAWREGLKDYDPKADDFYSPLIDLLRAFARWIYKGLETEYYYRLEDEQVEDSITANEYEFTEDGRRP